MRFDEFVISMIKYTVYSIINITNQFQKHWEKMKEIKHKNKNKTKNKINNNGIR